MVYDIEFSDYFLKKSRMGVPAELLRDVLINELAMTMRIPKEHINIGMDIVNQLACSATPIEMQIALDRLELNRDYRPYLRQSRSSTIEAAKERKRQLMERASFAKAAEERQRRMNIFTGGVNETVMRKAMSESSDEGSEDDYLWTES